MGKSLVAALAALFFLTGSCWAADFSLVLNDSSVQGALGFTLDQNDYGESQIGGRVLYNDDRETLLGSLGAGVSGSPGNIPGVKLGASILANLGRTDGVLGSQNIIAFGLGLQASYQPPQLEGLGIYGRAQYAPKILSFSDSERLWEGALGASYMITPKAAIMLEYQKVNVELKKYGRTAIDDSVRAGVQFYF